MSAADPAAWGTSGTATRRSRLRVAVALAAVVIALLAAAVVVGPPRPGEAYDPGNVGPDGLAGLVELLGQVDVDVEVSREPPSDISTHLFIATDRLGDDQRDAVSTWVEAGGTLIVAGPSPLHGMAVSGGSVVDMFGATPRAPECDLPVLAEVGAVEHAVWDGLVVPDDQPTHVRCFPMGDADAWMVVTEVGAGRVVALGSATPFVNTNLDRADNAVLAAALLAPTPGDRVVLVPPAAVGEGDTAVVDLVPAGFWRLLALGSVAAVLAVLWRARRLGSPVQEHLPPVLPSAELARSVAALLQRSGDRGTAAARLRADTQREARHVFGVPPGTGDQQLVDLVVSRTGVDRGSAELALLGWPVRDDDTLRALARACLTLRGHLRHPEPATQVRTDQPIER